MINVRVWYWDNSSEVLSLPCRVQDIRNCSDIQYYASDCSGCLQPASNIILYQFLEV